MFSKRIRELLELYEAVKAVFEAGSASVAACIAAANVDQVGQNDPRLARHKGADLSQPITGSK